MLLQVLEDGRLTDSQGRTVDFKNAVLIMTSNIGLSSLSSGGNIGFRQKKDDDIPKEKKYEMMKKKVLEEVKKVFKPEFINRLDETIVFQTLEMDEMKKIVHLLVNRTMREVEGQGYTMITSDAAKEMIAEEGFDPQYGARPLRRAIQKLIEDPLAEEFIRNTPAEGSVITVDLDEEKKELTFDIKEPEKKPEPKTDEASDDKEEVKTEKAKESKKAGKSEKDEKSEKSAKSDDKSKDKDKS